MFINLNRYRTDLVSFHIKGALFYIKLVSFHVK